jgi:hypothetical protein
MKPCRVGVLALLIVLAASATRSAPDSSGVPAASGFSEYRAADPDAPPVTEENLLASERFWPYRVGLTGPWQPAREGASLRPNAVGVLIRVEPSGMPRIDFGSAGKYEVPVAGTDLLERSNQIRLGAVEKRFPNFIHAIRTRMLDPRAAPLRPLNVEEVTGRSGFLCVYADPAAEDFGELARALIPLRERHGVLTILFPQGVHGDAAVGAQLRSLEWPVPFLADFLSEPYTRTLLVEGTRLPTLVLQTSEGRVLYEGRGKGDVAALTAALDAAFGSASEGSLSSRSRSGTRVIGDRHSVHHYLLPRTGLVRDRAHSENTAGSTQDWHRLELSRRG